MNNSRISAGLGAVGAVAMIATVAWTVQTLAPAMGGAGPMLGTATLIAAGAAAVGGLSLLGLRRPSRIWILQAFAGAVVAAGPRAVPPVSAELAVARCGSGVAGRRRLRTDGPPAYPPPDADPPHGRGTGRRWLNCASTFPRSSANTARMRSPPVSPSCPTSTVPRSTR